MAAFVMWSPMTFLLNINLLLMCFVIITALLDIRKMIVYTPRELKEEKDDENSFASPDKKKQGRSMANESEMQALEMSESHYREGGLVGNDSTAKKAKFRGGNVPISFGNKDVVDPADIDINLDEEDKVAKNEGFTAKKGLVWPPPFKTLWKNAMSFYHRIFSILFKYEEG